MLSPSASTSSATEYYGWAVIMVEERNILSYPFRGLQQRLRGPHVCSPFLVTRKKTNTEPFPPEQCISYQLRACQCGSAIEDHQTHKELSPII